MFKYLVEKLTTYWNTKNDTPISWPQPLLAMVQQFRHHPGPPKQRRMEESKHRFIFWPPKCRHLTFTCHKGHSKFKPLRTHASEPTQNQLCIYIYIYIYFIYLKQHIYIYTCLNIWWKNWLHSETQRMTLQSPGLSLCLRWCSNSVIIRGLRSNGEWKKVDIDLSFDPQSVVT